ncbi:hypothetical protein LZ32DRAFT_76570 [Colletotrichum eremochloae]|nr:hypothetical protein LZ32DRAFT_76570 [Colletotrichum eremochloae]
MISKPVNQRPHVGRKDKGGKKTIEEVKAGGARLKQAKSQEIIASRMASEWVTELIPRQKCSDCYLHGLVMALIPSPLLHSPTVAQKLPRSWSLFACRFHSGLVVKVLQRNLVCVCICFSFISSCPSVRAEQARVLVSFILKAPLELISIPTRFGLFPCYVYVCVCAARPPSLSGFPCHPPVERTTREARSESHKQRLLELAF